MIQTRHIGRAKVTRVVEYAAPTHDPAFLFPDLPQTELDSLAPLITPHHYIPSMNRLIVTIQLWIVQIDDKVVVIDTGVGNLKPRAAARMNMLNTRLPEWMAAAGAPFDKVTHVLLTHLHMDHTGWNTVHDGDGWKPTFPNARYIVPRREYEYWGEKLRTAPDSIMDGSWNDSIMPIVNAGLADFIDDDAGKILGCFQVEPVPGHSPGMTGYRLLADGEEGFFCADVFHSPLQVLKPDLNTAYCALPDQARATRARVLADAAERGTLLMPMHWGEPCCGYIRRDDNGYRFEGADWPPLSLD